MVFALVFQICFYSNPSCRMRQPNTRPPANSVWHGTTGICSEFHLLRHRLTVLIAQAPLGFHRQRRGAKNVEGTIGESSPRLASKGSFIAPNSETLEHGFHAFPLLWDRPQPPSDHCPLAFAFFVFFCGLTFRVVRVFRGVFPLSLAREVVPITSQGLLSQLQISIFIR